MIRTEKDFLFSFLSLCLRPPFSSTLFFLFQMEEGEGVCWDLLQLSMCTKKGSLMPNKSEIVIKLPYYLYLIMSGKINTSPLDVSVPS